MDDEHLALVVDLVHLKPPEVVGLATALEGQDAKVVDAKVQLITSVVLHTVNTQMSLSVVYIKHIVCELLLVVLTVKFNGSV